MLIIKEGDKEYKFRASGATKILYKRLFGEDPDKFWMIFQDQLKENMTPEDQNRILEVAKLDEKDPKRIAVTTAVSTEILNRPEMADNTLSLFEFAKQYAYIAFVEANNDPKDVGKILSLENYILFLMEFDESFFREHFAENQRNVRNKFESNVEKKKHVRPIDREENIGTYLLRAKQLGLSWFELFELRQGEVVDMMIEKENDSAQYDYIATQDDMDHVFD